jgi:hypothetical protein
MPRYASPLQWRGPSPLSPGVQPLYVCRAVGIITHTPSHRNACETHAYCEWMKGCPMAGRTRRSRRKQISVLGRFCCEKLLVPSVYAKAALYVPVYILPCGSTLLVLESSIARLACGSAGSAIIIDRCDCKCRF